jgi:tRNA 2-selenouridine synthase SelU
MMLLIELIDFYQATLGVIINRLKQKAKRIKKNNKYKSLTHSEALDIVAKEYGYQNWSLLMRHVNRYHTAFLSMPRLEDNK